ncbi:MAG TPA: putative DNA binding domain-containing protein [Saprospiraceae bacterium]|nr:putative DNA binding domain-containing protein [Saprospiraceae bacterium]HPI06603.1 putative DNA binding domain-containing protein [Saprospiraceae bacterium]
MGSEALLKLIGGGETSQVQFKENITNPLGAAQELVAFANTEGGQIIVGVVDKTGMIAGLSFEDIQRISSLLVNAASEGVKPPLTIKTESVEVNGKKVLIVTVPNGAHKPYKDKDGLIFIKNGPDKRKVTSNEELARLLQASGDLYAEEMPLPFTIADELDVREFRQFYEEKYQNPLDESELPRLLANLRLAAGDRLNVAGALLFAKHPEKVVPPFFISAVWFDGTDIAGEKYHSSEDIRGTLSQLYQRGLDFMKRALNRPQNGKDFNSLGDLEIPEVVLKELLVNALLHRDYFIRDSIKIFVFDDRIEIRSPGKLPNNLTEAQIRAGIRRSRNTILASLAPDVLPYRGIGSGILRSLKAWPDIEFENDKEGEEFRVVIGRKRKS